MLSETCRGSTGPFRGFRGAGLLKEERSVLEVLLASSENALLDWLEIATACRRIGNHVYSVPVSREIRLGTHALKCTVFQYYISERVIRVRKF